ncbi:hypothetical protein [Rhodococcoides yunnanense]|uniref:hypothetical protein n=1 Tax=Rhodococcoides yunnanense TaxID=278209 RepID=UPI000932BCC8|nr:hypothetical protein [Rhodococcus yunnanensis]
MSSKILDPDSALVLSEILAEPALPVGTAAAGPGGARGAALREAVDHLTSVRTSDVRGRTEDETDAFLRDLAAIDPELADVLRWHVALIAVLEAHGPSRARNAVLGDIARGDVLTLATDVRRWQWREGRAPGEANPIAAVDGEVSVDEYPGLYDYILVSVDGTLVALPTHRDRVEWEPQGGAWSVRLDRVTVHRDELIDLGHHPREAAGWREPIHTARRIDGIR